MTRSGMGLCGAMAAVAFWCVAVQAPVLGAETAAAADKKKGLAVMTLKNASGITASEAELITDRLGVELFNTGKVNVMERSQMQEVLKEQGFQQSGACTDEACLVEMGQMLGVQFLVSGSIGKLGSMYMINLRVINVTTAEIAHVVSEDVSGGIEQVVGRLPAIARQLVTSSKPPQPEATKTKAKEEKPKETPPPPPPPPVEEKPAEKPAEEAKPAPAPEPPPPPVADKRAERNKNRGGVRLMGTFLLGAPKGEIHSSYPITYHDLFRLNDEWYEEREDSGYTVGHSRGSFAAQLVFMIPAGRFIAIDAGAGLRYFADIWEAERYDDRKEDELRFITPHITTGLAFVYRFFPGKVNVGVVADVGVNIIRYSYTDYDVSYGSYVRDAADSWDDDAVRVNVAFGPRVGLEILGGPHFGFALEFSYRFTRVTTDLDFYDGDKSKYEFKLPGVGLSAGFNFYF